jgi:transcriptional regulatory protein LEU3
MPKGLEELHHCAVTLHLHLYSFFNREARLERRDDLVALYLAATSFLDRVFNLQRENRLMCAPYHIMQMALAAGFALLKLLNSDFAARLPTDGRQYVLLTIEALRKSKVETNDLLDRFAEVLAQLWKESSRGRSLHSMSQSPVVSNPGMPSMFNSQVQPPQQQDQPGHRRDSSGKLPEGAQAATVRYTKGFYRHTRRSPRPNCSQSHEYECSLRLRLALARIAG